MEQVIKHYGPAILAILVIVLLGAILAGILTTDGFVATQFKNALTDFFTRMTAMMP